MKKKKQKKKKTANGRKKEQLSDLSFPTTFAVNTREKLYVRFCLSQKIPAEYY